VWQAYEGDRAISNYQVASNTQGNVQLLDPEWSPTPSEPKAAGESYHKTIPTSLRKVTGKRNAFDAEVVSGRSFPGG